MYHSSRWARARAAALWTAVTSAVVVLARVAATTVRDAAVAPAPTFADLLVAGSAVVAVLAGGWLWVVTATVALDVLRAGDGAGARAGVGPVRRALLTACGVAVLVAAAQPASGDTGPDAPAPAGVRGDHPLAGLPLPDRATGGDGSGVAVRAEPRPQRPDEVVRVRPGDSLWAVARAALGPAATTGEIAAHWPAIYRANRAVIGDDPDLIHPGQRLHLPPRPSPPGGTS